MTSADYVAKQMRLETSFLNEVRNARRCSGLIASSPELRDKVYVPNVYPEVASSDRIMVMEFVDGCKITDKKKIEGWGFSPREVMDVTIESGSNSMQGLLGQHAHTDRCDTCYPSASSAMCFDWGFVRRFADLCVIVSQLTGSSHSPGTLRSASRKHPRQTSSRQPEEAASHFARPRAVHLPQQGVPEGVLHSVEIAVHL